ncbi:prepilin peptidase [Candidatus Microgenomates bacterium]|nr:MAG: prepilin peptidase [Candidatus Microgenomates bacterium]
MSLFVFILGASLGSFIAALSWRMPRDISIGKGRSFCPNCKAQIAWHDNIPILSYLYLRGKCRACKKPISSRYFWVELTTGGVFFLLWIFQNRLIVNIDLLSLLPLWATYLFLVSITLLCICIFVIDYEHQIIPDELVFLGFAASVLALLASGTNLFYVHLLTGFLSATFFLLIVLATKGAGMGLGDVKLAVFLGSVLGVRQAIVWMFMSFVLGACVGVLLIAAKKYGMKSKIAFGPFIVASFLLTALFGAELISIIIPYTL